MAAFVKFRTAITHIAAGVHAAALNADTDTLKAYFTNNAPDVDADAIKADLAGLSAGNGYTDGVDVQNAASTTAGVITVVGTDFTVTASGGSVGPFRYVVLYNDTPTSPADPLLGYWDYGSSITLASGESFTTDFGASLFTLGA
jgi:hypothetical protein